MTANGPHTISIVSLTAAEWQQQHATPLKATRRWFTAQNLSPTGALGGKKNASPFQRFLHTAIKSLSHTPDVYAASAAVSHSLVALTQMDSKRMHSSRLSLTCDDKEKCRGPRSDSSAAVNVFSAPAVALQRLTSARWPMITCQILSSSAGENFPSESKYPFWRAMSVWTAC